MINIVVNVILKMVSNALMQEADLQVRAEYQSCLQIRQIFQNEPAFCHLYQW